MIRYLIVIVFFLASSASLVLSPCATSNVQQEKKPKNVIPAQDLSDSISRRDSMRAKLMFTQNIFAGLIASDFDAIETAVAEVQTITGGEKWIAIDNQQYRELTAEFKKSADRLMKAAKSRNIDATALRYYELSTRCIDCHQHLRAAAYEL